LVVAADCRLGEPGSSWELNCGDGAVAFLIGTSEVIAEIEASYSVCDEMMDVWRTQDDQFIRSAESRFITEEGYVRVSNEAISGLMKNFNYSEQDFTKAVFGLADLRTQAGLAKGLGFDVKTQLQDSLFSQVGDIGAAYSLMLLQAALEDATTNDRILLLSYGNGSDAMSVRATDRIANKAKDRGIKRNLESKNMIDDYTTYLRRRDLLPRFRPAHDFGYLSPPALLREVEANIRFHGVKCNVCGTVQYPPQEVCTKCHTRNQFEKVRLSDKKGRVITYSMDYLLTWMREKPTIAAVVNFEGGGRVHTYITDAKTEEIKIDMPVKMSFRLLDFREGIYQYIWKCVPIR
ncbi:OB-fold domain-containing protein, partial [bacterium]|nr:OB-fold domain-containing protein [bacterium]